ncbi:hypothetical protein OAN61_00750 [bacterium]|nr:hypothetical protein [bacterium]
MAPEQGMVDNPLAAGSSASASGPGDTAHAAQLRRLPLRATLKKLGGKDKDDWQARTALTHVARDRFHKGAGIASTSRATHVCCRCTGAEYGAHSEGSSLEEWQRRRARAQPPPCRH